MEEYKCEINAVKSSEGIGADPCASRNAITTSTYTNVGGISFYENIRHIVVGVFFLQMNKNVLLLLNHAKMQLIPIRKQWDKK